MPVQSPSNSGLRRLKYYLLVALVLAFAGIGNFSLLVQYNNNLTRGQDEDQAISLHNYVQNHESHHKEIQKVLKDTQEAFNTLKVQVEDQAKIQKEEIKRLTNETNSQKQKIESLMNKADTHRQTIKEIKQEDLEYHSYLLQNSRVGNKTINHLLKFKADFEGRKPAWQEEAKKEVLAEPLKVYDKVVFATKVCCARSIEKEKIILAVNSIPLFFLLFFAFLVVIMIDS